VLLLRSTESLKVRGWDDRMHVCDGVLNVDHMHRSVPKLGRSVTEVPIAQAVHDVFLSRAAARQQALGAYGDWIDALSVPLALPSRR
jgi:alpha-beta hydrolase superfamily lysophospholipase